jgi:transposase
VEVGRANIFVATMAASGYSFCLATPRQTAADWLHGSACALTSLWWRTTVNHP